MVLKKNLESPLDWKEIQPVQPKGNQSWIIIGKIDAEVEAPILWPPDAKSWFIWKDPDAGKDWRQEENAVTQDEMVGWHHWLDGHEFEQSPGGGDGQGSLLCCSPWGREESDTTEWLTFTFYFHELEKEMATHSNVLAWRIPGMREPGGLPAMGSHRVGHDRSDLAAAAAAERLNWTQLDSYSKGCY